MTGVELTEPEMGILRIVFAGRSTMPSELRGAVETILAGRLATGEADRSWPWSSVSSGHDRVDKLTAAEQNAISDAVHAPEENRPDLDCACEPVYAVVGRIIAALRKQSDGVHPQNTVCTCDPLGPGCTCGVL
jgi:hypothetical protein